MGPLHKCRWQRLLRAELDLACAGNSETPQEKPNFCAFVSNCWPRTQNCLCVLHIQYFVLSSSFCISSLSECSCIHRCVNQCKNTKTYFIILLSKCVPVCTLLPERILLKQHGWRQFFNAKWKQWIHLEMHVRYWTERWMLQSPVPAWKLQRKGLSTATLLSGRTFEL